MKLWNLQAFYEALQNYHLGSDGVLKLGTYVLPVLEIACGMALFIKAVRLGALNLIGLMIVLFEVYLISAWLRDLDISCGCFGDSETSTNLLLHIAGNVALLIAVGYVYVTEIKAGKLEPRMDTNLHE